MAEAVTVEALGRPGSSPSTTAYRTVDGNIPRRQRDPRHRRGDRRIRRAGCGRWSRRMDGAREGRRRWSPRSLPHPPGSCPARTPARRWPTCWPPVSWTTPRASVPVPPRKEGPLQPWCSPPPLDGPHPHQPLGQPQLRLRRARVLLIGVGGTGGHAAQALVASGVGHVHCRRPGHGRALQPQPPAPVPRVRPRPAEGGGGGGSLRALNSDVTVTGERGRWQGRKSLAELVARVPRRAGAAPVRATTGEGRRPGRAASHIRRTARTRRPAVRDRRRARASRLRVDARPCSPPSPYDLLVLAADRPDAIRRWTNRVCLAAGLPWVDAGYRVLS